MAFDFTPGSLVTLRNRPWVVLPSDDRELFLIKPLGGSDNEITGIYKPLGNESDIPVSYNFRKPGIPDLGDFRSARLLYNASRLLFRNAAGPFRCLGKLSFRPRAYQMVPLIMALKMETVRILIADDVGVGKTIEALLIAKELYDRKEIKRFAVVCLPHLCDQWQDELKNKFGIEAAIIRSGTVRALEKKIRVNQNVFQAFPFQIISIDYIKSGANLEKFLVYCPEMLLVDEAHTCAKPAGANHSQQLRHNLLYEISKKSDKHLIMLTATPHSGKQEEFQSLLGLIKREFSTIEITSSTKEEREELAKHFVQRRRVDIVKWLDEETTFPERYPDDLPYPLGNEYSEFFNEILSYAREMIAGTSIDERKQRYNYWDALALLRGVMSSPEAGISMLVKKSQKKKLSEGEDETEQDNPEEERNSVMDRDFSSDDNLPLSVLGKIPATDSESRRLLGYARKMESLRGLDKDNKASEAVFHIKKWIDRGFNPIIFCRYIQTAKYLGTIFTQALSGKAWKNIHLEVITSELNDELRREKIDQMLKSERRVLIATDCLSEGINLQDGFNAMLHYDLPWNPNRLEQREGRIDRFGQKSEIVEVGLLYGSNNPIDGVVLEVLLRKAREIRKAIGISVPFPENSTTVMQAVMNAVLLKPSVKIKQVSVQLSLFEAEEIEEEKKRAKTAFDEAAEREKVSRSIFAQNAIKAHEIESDLKAVDEAIGDTNAVEMFIVESLRFLGVQVEQKKQGYKIYTTNIPQRLRILLTDKNDILVSFKSPTPEGYKYLGRNHPFTEHLSQTIVNDALEQKEPYAARTSVVRTSAVSEKTVLFQFRVRNVIAEQPYNREIVAEEMWLWGYKGALSNGNFIGKEEALDLLFHSTPVGNVEHPEQQFWLSEESKWIMDEPEFRKHTDPVAMTRANMLVEMHSRVRKLLKGSRYKVVEPVLPMDVLGVYILLPVIN